MAVRAECTHIATESGQTIKVELIGATYGGASREVKGAGSDWARLTYDQLEFTDLFNTVVQRGRLDFSYWVQDATDEAILDEIIAAGQGEYTMKLYIGGSAYWTGEVMLDQLGAQEEGMSYPYRVRLTAKDFTTLEKGLFPLEDNRQTIAKIAGRILNETGYGLNIWTQTSWIEENTTAGNDFMRQIYAETRNLRDYSKSGDLQITYLEALTRILAPFRCVVRQESGVFTISQWSEYETPSAVLRTVYDNDGDYVSQSEVNTTVAANSTVKVVSGSTSEFKPGYKRVSSTYAHRTQTSGIQVPDVVTLDETNTSDLFQQVIEINATDINQRISVNTTAFVNFDEEQTAQVIGTEPVVGVRLAVTVEGVTKYWNNSSGLWQSTAFTNNFATRSTDNAAKLPLLPEELYQSFVASIAFTTLSLFYVNDGLAGFGTISLTLVRATTTRPSETTFEGTSLVIGSNNEQDASQALAYTLTQDGAFSKNFNGGTYYFGSGPLVSSPGSLRYGTGDLEVVGLWARRGDTPEYLFHVQNLKEVMDLYRGWAKVMTARIHNTGYDTTKTLVYNSGNYNAIGGTFDGYTGWWTALVFENNLVTSALDNIALGIIGSDTQLITGAYTAARLSSQNALERSGGYAFRLALDRTGVITQLFVQSTLTEYPRLLKDAEIRVVHPITLDDYVFVVSEDMSEGSLVIPVVSQTITDTIPAGSFVYTNPADAAAAILIGREAIRAVARSRAVGVLRNAVDGFVTTLDVVLYEPLRDGQDFKVFNPDTLVEYDVTVDGSFNVTDTTITIQEQLVIAPVGAYITGSEAYKQAEQIITPAQVQTRVIRTENAVSLGDLANEIGAGTTVTVLNLENTATGTTVLSGTIVIAKAYNGDVQEFEVDGEQTINADPFALSVVSVVTSVDLDAGDAVEQPSFSATGQIATNAGQVVLKATTSSGSINKLALVRLDATAASGSAILLQADQITVDGQTTFLNSLAENGFNSIPENNVVIYSDTAPATREDLSPLVTGDVWRETDQNDRPYVWTGTAWKRGFTLIDGGTLVTGTLIADNVKIQNASSTPALTIDGDGINLVYQSYLTDLGSGLKWYDGATLKGVIWNDASEGDNTLNYFVTDATGRHLFGAGASDPDERFEINASFARTGLGQDFRFFGEVRIYDDDFSHYTNLVFNPETTDNRTITFPNATGTIALLEQAQTFTANQTFGYGNFLLQENGGTDALTLRYSGTANRTMNIPNIGGTGSLLATTGSDIYISGNPTLGTLTPDYYITLQVIGGATYRIPLEIQP